MLTIYTTPTRPDCRALKAWLDREAKALGDLDGWKAYAAVPPGMVEATMATATVAGLRSPDLDRRTPPVVA
jgi:NAD(P)H-flavin reductase